MCDHSGTAVKFAAAVFQEQKPAHSWVSAAQQPLDGTTTYQSFINYQQRIQESIVLCFFYKSVTKTCELNKELSSRWCAKKSSLLLRTADVVPVNNTANAILACDQSDHISTAVDQSFVNNSTRFCSTYFSMKNGVIVFCFCFDIKTRGW